MTRRGYRRVVHEEWLHCLHCPRTAHVNNRGRMRLSRLGWLVNEQEQTICPACAKAGKTFPDTKAAP